MKAYLGDLEGGHQHDPACEHYSEKGNDVEDPQDIQDDVAGAGKGVSTGRHHDVQWYLEVVAGEVCRQMCR